jgi:integrase
MAWVTGMRRSELAGLQLSDYASIGEEEGELTIAGKGDKVRRVAVYNGAWQWLADWLELRGSEPGPLFLAINKGGRWPRCWRSGGRRPDCHPFPGTISGAPSPGSCWTWAPTWPRCRN